jgi:methyl-accepting chemotaxis protein
MRISLEKPYASVAQFRNQSILFALVASLPLMLVVFLFIRRFVTRPLQAMASGLSELAKGEGDLTRRLEVKHQDEIGKTAGLFNQMLGPLPIWSAGGHRRAQCGFVFRQLRQGAEKLADGSRAQNASRRMPLWR